MTIYGVCCWAVYSCFMWCSFSCMENCTQYSTLYSSSLVPRPSITANAVEGLGTRLVF